MTTSSATTPLKQIICIKWGKKFGADYVNKLYGMVSRNITPPFRFVVLPMTRSVFVPEVNASRYQRLIMTFLWAHQGSGKITPLEQAAG